jgi:hypothetical protein
MLFSLISLVLFGVVYYFLWTHWCCHAAARVAPGAPNWVKHPNFLIFFFVTLRVLLVYRNAARR